MNGSDDAAGAFWDAHQHVSEDPAFWMAHPRCRVAINRRVCGDPAVWPLDAFKRFVIRRFRRGLSLGSGLGNLERAARRLELCEEIEGVDGSLISIRLARSRAEREGLAGISYRSGNLNALRLPRSTYDVVFFHASLHHVRSVEKLLARVERAMTDDGMLFVEEWTGPSRTEWSNGTLARLRALYDELPASWRAFPSLRPPIEAADPSEAVRSSAILPGLRRLFDVVVERPYGGHLVAVILSQLSREGVGDAEREALIERLLALEDADLAEDPTCSFHTALVARRKQGLRRVAGHLFNLAARFALLWTYWGPEILRSSRGRLRRIGKCLGRW